MAFLPSESPAISVREVDLSGIVPAVTSSTGALVGGFNWGPVETPRLVGNEGELVSQFGSPKLVDSESAIDFLSATQFLKYSGSLYVSRTVDVDLARNAHDSADAVNSVLVKNIGDWESKIDTYKDQTAIATRKRFVAKYPGKVGNSLKVSYCPWSTADASWAGWSYASYFDAPPATSDYVNNIVPNAHDEVHVAIIDEDGVLTGTPNSVLETFPFVSMAKDAKKSDGTSNFVLDVINNTSSYVWAAALDSSVHPTNLTASEWTATTITGAGENVYESSFNAGANGDAPSRADYVRGFEDFKDPDTLQIDFLIAPGLTTSNDDHKTVVNNLAEIAGNDRKDCVAVASPPRDKVIGVTDTAQITTDVKLFADSCSSSSYLVLDNNYLKVYNKYQDKYEYVPAASSTAGLMAATDNVAAPWYSPAGQRRGQYFGVSSLAWSATKSQRDTLYKNGVNPIISFPGQGVLLFGDKTKLARPSAFDRINVRRLFLLMERAIKQAAEQVMFEFNDEFTRAEFVNIVEPYLRDIKGRRGITDFRVVCDETNNTAQIIDTNQFVADIYVKPARSINYVTLSFVAVRTGVDFEEVVGLA